MRIAGDGSREQRERGKRALRAAIDAGYTQFDHADIYGGGACEALFGELLRESPAIREQLLITGKCGIRKAKDGAPGRYDFSTEHIRASVDASLARLATDRLDFLLLHRPDYLMNVNEVADTFAALHSAGKVAHFGVSNFSPSQVTLLQSALPTPLMINQVEINLHDASRLSDGTLDQCQAMNITPQAWSPIAGVAYPARGNTFTAEDEARIRIELERQGREYGVDDWQVALAWLLKHPAGISPIIGSTTPSRIEAAVGALDIDYTREDWYRLFEARNGAPVP